MRFTAKVSYISFILLFCSSNAFADVTNSPPVVFHKEPIPQVDVIPTNDPMVDLIEVNGEAVYQVGPPTLSETTRASYNGLSLSQKAAFHSKRQVRLKMLAQVLSMKKKAQGWFVAIKDKVFRKKAPIADAEADAIAQEHFSPAMTSAILNFYNNNLWNKMRSLGGAFDQQGIEIVFGIKAQAGLWNKPLGGAWFYTMNIGYNNTLKALVVEIERQKERFDGGVSADIALISKIFYYQGVKNEENSTRTGYAYYPPSIPFVGIGSEASADRRSGGVYFSLGPDIFSYGASRNEIDARTIAVFQIKGPRDVTTAIKLVANQFVAWIKRTKPAEVQQTLPSASSNCREYLSPTDKAA